VEKRAWRVLLVADSVSSAASVRADIGQGGISSGDLIWLETSWIDLSVQDHPADVLILVESGAGWPGLAWLRACCTDSLPPILYLVPTASTECESVAARAGVLLFALDELHQPGPVLRRALEQALRLGLGRPTLQDQPGARADSNQAVADSLAGQEALRYRNAELEEVIASITEIQISFDRDFRFISINPAATKFYFRGYQVEDLLGRVMWEMFPNMVGGIFDVKYHEAIESGQPVHFEAYFQPQDVWFEAHVFPNYGRLDVYLRDISARKRAELERERLMADLNHERVRLVYLVESLRASEELYRATFENASVGISHISLTGEWLKVNDRLCEITGYSRDELLKTNFQAIT
jgi:PAS domain S-box-containing protein